MVNKILTFLAVFLAVVAIILAGWCSYQSKCITSLKTAKTALEANNALLVKKLEKEHDDKMEISRKNTELKAKIDNYKGDFDWRTDLSNNPVLLEFKRLYKN